MQYEIIDNFLPRSELKKLKLLLNDDDFPWNIVEHKVDANDNLIKHCTFTHNVYEYNVPKSILFEELNLILDRIKIRSLLNIYIKMELVRSEIIEKKPLIQLPFPHQTSILNLNSSDEKTCLYFENDDLKVESVENRMLSFDSTVKHTNTNCTNQHKSISIIFNYF